MRLHLDEDSSAGLLVKLLQSAGHDVTTSVGAGLIGQSDAIQLTSAIQHNRVFLTHNFEDFEDLHDLIAATNGRHLGILVVRKENNSARDLSPRGIVNAIRKLELSASPVANEYITLNQWR